jgi:hypothetical protein
MKTIDANRIEIETLYSKIGNKIIKGDKNIIKFLDQSTGMTLEVSNGISSDSFVGFSL